MNNYVYAMDPVNQYDLSGKFIPMFVWGIVAAVLYVAPTVYIATSAIVSAVGGGAGPKVPANVGNVVSGTVSNVVGNGVKNVGKVPRQATETLKRVDRIASPFRSEVFRNREGRLPQRSVPYKPINYTEHDIYPLKPGVNRGQERLVTGDDGSAWYTFDHYETFIRIR